ncbi:uncharacterized protein LOC116169130 [Photinus pyralis]|uniref:uncharacterized protein LOC116169130 n=1 Tax=Photinus pyralis TaxID=7054 RepID=UPI0012674859|nr:uncharacterized protein LOC116169130 [Photinus pyralis]
MADLPKSRLAIDRPFAKVGVDYFGPFLIKEGGRRSKRTRKVYGCVFVCMLTKAVHCEVVESLTTEAFIACFKRFISRRGLSAEIFCDNATNFVGTSNELRELYTFLENVEIISDAVLQYRVKWNFNPPKAPHFGGLWEAAVKSFKNHIYKIVAHANLEFIEFYTLLIEIEGVLNSRPLIPMSSDPNDLDFLTPGHFLIGDHMRALPELDLSEEKPNRLSRWQRIQQLRQQFWKKWSRDYVQELQRRQKWKIPGDTTLTVGQLVLLQEDNAPSRHWKLGRVTKVHPGPDNVVRAATIKTSHGEVKRPSVRLCVLPTN